MDVPVKTFRFKISNDNFYNQIIEFSKIHCYENNKLLKQNFQQWCESDNIKKMIEKEQTILEQANYDLKKNNIYNKIYKSIKYYHIKNILKEMNVNSENKNEEEKKEKVKLVIFSKDFINIIKQYISDNINNRDFKPSVYYDLFYETKSEEITFEFKKQNIKNKLIDKTIFAIKLKKMFKNQYFMLFKQ